MKHQIKAIQGDITEQSTDAIVNAANRGLFGGSGVCGAIFDAAGYDDMTKACKEIGYCETGEAVITPGFKLSAKYVIHTVGPVYGQNDGHDAELLQSCYWTSLARAEEKGITSITFPLISTGIYGYPKEEAIRISIDAVREYFYDNDDSAISEVRICAWSNEDYSLLTKILNR